MYTILKHIVVKDQNVLNMQKTAHCSGTNTTSLTQGLDNESVIFPVMSIIFFKCNV